MRLEGCAGYVVAGKLENKANLKSLDLYVWQQFSKLSHLPEILTQDGNEEAGKETKISQFVFIFIFVFQS